MKKRRDFCGPIEKWISGLSNMHFKQQMLLQAGLSARSNEITTKVFQSLLCFCKKLLLSISRKKTVVKNKLKH